MNNSKRTSSVLIIATALLIAMPITALAKERRHLPYEIWGADQSNSVAGAAARGTDGSFIWVWDSRDIELQVNHGIPAQPLGCDGNNNPGDGPCDLKDVFLGNLAEYDQNGATGRHLDDYLYGRLHGALPDPQNRYMNINLFGPGNGFVGIIDGATKEAVALFRVTGTTSGQRVHMSFWNSDGSALLIANLNGKVLERIDITRNRRGRITGVAFNQGAGLGVGKDLSVTDSAKVYLGNNAHGIPMIGTIVGEYVDADLSDLTPNGFCRENGCDSNDTETPGTDDGSLGGRVNNVIICPIVSKNDNAYITFGGGGLLIADTSATPMRIVGEYTQQIINGAGCGGVQVGNKMWLNAGVSASESTAAVGPGGFKQSTFTIYTLNDNAFDAAQGENSPLPVTVYNDADDSDGNAANTAEIGNVGGAGPNLTGQIPGETTRRDSHGMARTVSGRYVHTVDRIQNVVEVINTQTLRRLTYDLTSRNGKGRGVGACYDASVTHEYGSTGDTDLPPNDPAPDLIETTPDGKYLAVALRGPIPVSVTHAAQGSCPGVGVIKLMGNGRRGRLATVLRTSNTTDDTPVSAPGGHDYIGTEHSDIHGASVRTRVELKRHKRRARHHKRLWRKYFRRYD